MWFLPCLQPLLLVFVCLFTVCLCSSVLPGPSSPVPHDITPGVSTSLIVRPLSLRHQWSIVCPETAPGSTCASLCLAFSFSCKFCCRASLVFCFTVKFFVLVAPRFGPEPYSPDRKLLKRLAFLEGHSLLTFSSK